MNTDEAPQESHECAKLVSRVTNSHKQRISFKRMKGVKRKTKQNCKETRKLRCRSYETKTEMGKDKICFINSANCYPTFSATDTSFLYNKKIYRNNSHLLNLSS